MKSAILFALSIGVAMAGGIRLPKHFSAVFSQMVTNPDSKVIKYRGKVLYSAVGRLKWSYLSPTKKEVCTDGKDILVVDHDLEQVTAYRIGKGFDLAHIVQQAKPYKKDVYVTEYKGRRYTLAVDERGRLQSVAYYDDLDNKVQIVFKKMHYGKNALPKQQMQCNYPANYDVMRG